MIAPVCASTTMVASQHGQMTVQLFASATSLHLRRTLRRVRNRINEATGGFACEYNTRARREGSRRFEEERAADESAAAPCELVSANARPLKRPRSC